MNHLGSGQQQIVITTLIAAVSSLVVFVCAGWAFVSITRKRMAERHELRRSFLEKLSGDELTRLLGDDSGRALLRDAISGGDHDERNRFGWALQSVFAGVACVVSAFLVNIPALGVAGLVLFAAGLGQVVAVFIYSRAKRRNET